MGVILELMLSHTLNGDNMHRGTQHADPTANEHYSEHFKKSTTARWWNKGEKRTHHNLTVDKNAGRMGRDNNSTWKLFFFWIECIMKKSGWESLVTFLWLKAFFPSFIPGLNKVQWGIKPPVLNYSLYFKIECMHGMFLKLGGGSVIHGKLKACWVNNLLSHSNNFQLKFLDPNKGKRDHSVILQFTKGKEKRWERERHL